MIKLFNTIRIFFSRDELCDRVRASFAAINFLWQFLYRLKTFHAHLHLDSFYNKKNCSEEKHINVQCARKRVHTTTNSVNNRLHRSTWKM